MSWLSSALHTIASWRKHLSVDDLLNDSRWMIKRLESLANRKIIEAQTHVSAALWSNELAEHARGEAERATKSVAELKRMYGIAEPEPELPEAANIDLPPDRGGEKGDPGRHPLPVVIQQ